MAFPSPGPMLRGTTSRRARIHLLSAQPDPELDLRDGSGALRRIGFRATGQGRTEGELRHVAEFRLPPGSWQFRLGNSPEGGSGPFLDCRRDEFWLQDGQVFDYPPAPIVSASRVVKHRDFGSLLPERPLYIYLPRGYDQHRDRRYPVLYMHDGQNCFEAFAEESYAGSWRADETADWLIAKGQMRECIIVAVANGGEDRLSEYLPPYARHRFTVTARKKPNQLHAVTIGGRGDVTFRFYQEEVVPFVRNRYRTLSGRDHTATCGSSMGGLFSTYIAWENPDFARHHALLSPSYWMTRRKDGHLETVERLRQGSPRDLRLWLDSGTGKSGIPGRDDDNRFVTEEAHAALLENGFRQGRDFHYQLFEGAIHHESAWAARLDQVLRFLFPLDAPAGDHG